MNIPFPIKNTIDGRRSVRSYKMIGVEMDLMDMLKDYAKPLPVPFSHHVEIKFFKANPTTALYTVFKSPPDNMAFMSETDIISISKAGFIGELLILFAASKGLSTCWYGHYKLSELEKLMPHLQGKEQIRESNMGYGYAKGVTTGRRAICISPLGYYESSGLRLMDRFQKRVISFKRKEIRELLVNNNDFQKLSADVLYALDLGRKAPSAANSQMWRFAFGDSQRTIIISMPEGYRHFKWEHPNVDIGICACHVWLGCIDRGHSPNVTVHEESGRAVWKISI